MKNLLTWFDERFPVMSLWNDHLAQYYSPKNFNFWYFFGSLALLVLVLQIASGVFLAMNYKPDAQLAFASVEYIMRDVSGGWFIRYMHSTGASAFFIVVYFHMFRGLIYGSYKSPRELIWLIGMLIFLVLMATAFMGYLLPWGQMSYWGAQVIVNLFGAIPGIGPDLAVWIRGDYVVSDATLNRFYAFHFFLPVLILPVLVFLHLVALHKVGSNNPDGIEIKKNKDENGIPKDGIPFHPYYTVKDIVGVGGFLLVFFAVIFFKPEMGGIFLEHANFVPANPLQTPEHIAPVWYFTPFYTVLRAVPDPFLGVLAMGAAVVVLFFLPWIDTHPIKSWRYRSVLHKFAILFFVAFFFILGWLGMQPVTPFNAELGLRSTEIYFLFFVVLWFTSKPRSKAFSFLVFAIWMALIIGYDLFRLPSVDASLVWPGLTIPLVFLAVTLLGPVFTNLDEDKPVPERVTG